MGNMAQLVVFVALGAVFLSYGFQYSLFDILAGVLLFIVCTVGYFHWEERQKKKRSVELKTKAVPSQAVAAAPVAPVAAAAGGGGGMGAGTATGAGTAPFYSVPTHLKYASRAGAAGIKPRVLQYG